MKFSASANSCSPSTKIFVFKQTAS